MASKVRTPLFVDSDTTGIRESEEPDLWLSVELAFANFSPQVISVNMTREFENPGM